MQKPNVFAGALLRARFRELKQEMKDEVNKWHDAYVSGMRVYRSIAFKAVSPRYYIKGK